MSLLFRGVRVLTAALGAVLATLAGGTEFNARDTGAVGDGATLNTLAINRAVEAAAAAGGGTVVIPAGRYLSGTIYLRSNVTLHLEAGAVLLGSTELKDYPENPPPPPADTPEARRVARAATVNISIHPGKLEFGRYSLIFAAGQHNIAVTGRGVIDLQGDHPNFSKAEMRARGLSRDEAHRRRPYAIGFVQCQNVRVQGVTFRNLAFWCQGYLDCSDVLVDGVTVDSPAEDRNNDGIDIDSCRRFRVVNSSFNAGDDAICLKANLHDCEDVVIANNTCSSRANGVKFGTASNGGFKNIAISNLTMRQVRGAGLAFETVDGGVIDGVVVSNVVMHEVGAAIFIRLGDRGAKWMHPEDHAIGGARNISIQNVIAEVFTPLDGRPLASSISGLPGHPVENVSLSNVRIICRRSHRREETDPLLTAAIPEQATEYPEYSMFGALPAYGLFIRHARGVTLDNVEVTFAGEDRRSALVCDDVQDLRVRDWRSRAQPDSAAPIWLRGVKHAAIAGGAAPAGPANFLRVDGDSADIALVGVDLAAAAEPVSLAPALPPSTVREAGNLRR